MTESDLLNTRGRVVIRGIPMLSKSLVIATAAAIVAASPATAAHPNLFVNSALSGDNNYFYSVPGQSFVGGLDRVPGWTLSGYGFLSYPGLATLQNQQYRDQRLAGGPTNDVCAPGSCPNGFVDAPGNVNFIALDGDRTVNTSITQTVSGLTA
ncbi:MAG: hypothetical protein JO290_03585, partial [Sphingomonadaceae bacterium]|nr:hypothetical protein [Sphingomonadaceae bacterium]